VNGCLVCFSPAQSRAQSSGCCRARPKFGLIALGARIKCFPNLPDRMQFCTTRKDFAWFEWLVQDSCAYFCTFVYNKFSIVSLVSLVLRNDTKKSSASTEFESVLSTSPKVFTQSNRAPEHKARRTSRQPPKRKPCARATSLQPVS
jgi:hypothetical protein